MFLAYKVVGINMYPQTPYLRSKGKTESMAGENKRKYTKKNLPTTAKISHCIRGQYIREYYLKGVKEIKINQQYQISKDVNSLTFCGGGYGCMCWDNYSGSCNLYQVESNKKKVKKYNMIDKYKNQVGKIIIGPAELR